MVVTILFESEVRHVDMSSSAAIIRPSVPQDESVNRARFLVLTSSRPKHDASEPRLLSMTRALQALEVSVLQVILSSYQPPPQKPLLQSSYLA